MLSGGCGRMVIRWFGIGVLAASSVIGVPANAGPMSAGAPAVQVVLPNSGPRIERTYSVGETILELPILWASAATLGASVTIDLDGVGERLLRGEILALQVLTDDGGRFVRAYC